MMQSSVVGNPASVVGGYKDCLVHHSAIQGTGFKSLNEGDKVEFEVVQSPKGPAASNVRKV